MADSFSIMTNTFIHSVQRSSLGRKMVYSIQRIQIDNSNYFIYIKSFIIKTPICTYCYTFLYNILYLYVPFLCLHSVGENIHVICQRRVKLNKNDNSDAYETRRIKVMFRGKGEFLRYVIINS